MIQAITRAVQGQRGFGYIDAPLPADAKPIASLIGFSNAISPSASIRNAAVRPKYQSVTDSCLGMAGAQAFRLSCLKRGMACPDLSGLFPYKLGRASIGLEDTDGGMSFEGLMSAASRFGFASEEVWPFSIVRVNARPSGTALHDAYDRRGVRSYHSIERSDADGVRAAIFAGCAVVGAWAVDNMFGRDSGPTLIDTPDRDIAGNHAMVIEDYAADGSFGVLNHYGESWRDGGRARFTEQYIRASMGFMVFDVGAFQ
jgi:hypothetical protein